MIREGAPFPPRKSAPHVDYDKLMKKFNRVIDPKTPPVINPLYGDNINKGYMSRIYPGRSEFDIQLFKRLDFPNGTQELDFYKKGLEVVERYNFDEIPTLCHSLDYVVAERGIHPIRDFNGNSKFPKFLTEIHDWDSLIVPTAYKPPAEDSRLINRTLAHGCRYQTSTSSITSVLTQLYIFLTQKKPLNLNYFSRDLIGYGHNANRKSFTGSILKPTSFFLTNVKESVWSIDTNNGNAENNNQVLMNLGHSMERMLTMTEEDFNKKLIRANLPENSEPMKVPESYVFSKLGNMMFRSQIDCKSKFLPDDKNTFDLKTRATSSIRLNSHDPENYLSSQINKLVCPIDSYEKEYHDLIRSGGIKYAFQAKIGDMAGIFICYHNTKRIFGSEFIELGELERAIFWGRDMSDRMFSAINVLLQKILDTIYPTLDPNYRYRLLIDTKRDSSMLFFVEKLVEKDFRPLIFDYVNEKEKTENEAKQITNPVQLFRIKIFSTVNDYRVGGYLHFSPVDSFKVFYSMEEVKENVKEEYAISLVQSKLYNEFTE
eukprot:gene6172-7686_t